MTERISMNGTPVVGFGDANISITNPLIYAPFIGYVVGAGTGAVIGSYIHKSRVSTGVGTALGGFAGMAVGGQLALRRIRKRAEEDQTNE